MSREPDVVVVGAGAGGLTASWALVQRGLRVRLLEAGPRFDPASYPTHNPRFELENPFERELASPRHDGIESATGAPLDPEFDFLGRAGSGGRRQPFYHARAVGVGGSTLHYQGEAHRFPPHAFQMQSELGAARDWPIRYEDLAPFYARVEALLSVAGDANNPFKAPREPFARPAHPLSRASRRLGQAARALGWSHLPNTLAVLDEPRGERAACHYCNGCVRGCAVRAKSSVDVALLPEALATGRLELVTGFRAHRLEHGADGRIRAVVGRSALGADQRHSGAAFVLAGGAIETPRLLLNSAGGAHPAGVGNGSDQVGRHLMETLYAVCDGFFASDLETWVGLPIDARIYDWLRGTPEQPRGMGLFAMAGPYEGPVGYAVEAIPGFGAGHRAALRRRFGAGIQLVGIVEQLPRAENRVTLSDVTDGEGVPKARVHTAPDRGDLAAVAIALERVRQWAAEAGVETEYFATAYDTPAASHVAGTCRMGADPSESVVDPWCRIHGVPNAIVADASVFVTEGSGESPSLTIQALALRSAEALADRLGRGEA